ncbi:MAG: lysophospholipid acyltransferase family protein [Planctomycetes bacterium]|nr:lysophospholipid acyltransferase family protein [Planctomycetota bacterium]
MRATCARLGLRFASLLPLCVSHELGAWLAPLAIRFKGRARDSLLLNLELCFPDASPAARKELARASLAESFRTMLELGPLWCWDKPRVLSLVREVVGLEKLDAALASGRGVVLLGPHLGAWEMVGLYVSARAPTTSLYRAPRVPQLDGLYRRARERFGARLVPADAGGVRELYRALQRGELVGVLPDQDPGPGAGLFAPFFGVLANTSALTARLIASTRAVPLFGWAERLERGAGFRLHFVEPESSALRNPVDVEQATRALNLELERLILCRPQQYLWSYRRFRNRPGGEANPYRHGMPATERRASRLADGSARAPTELAAAPGRSA